MKIRFIFLLLFGALLLSTSGSAQSLVINSNTVEAVTADNATRNFYALADVLFIYRASTEAFEVQLKETRYKIWGGDIDSVTVTGASTAKWSKLEKLRYACLETTTTTGYRSFIPKQNVTFRYTTSTKRLELQHQPNRQMLWFGNIDSLHVTGLSTHTAKLAFLRATQGRPTFQEVVSAGDSATIAAGAAAGSSPTVAVTGNALSVTVTITPGTSPLTTGVIATTTLPITAPNGYRITGVTAKTADAAVAYTKIFWTTTTSTLVANASGSALTAATAYTFDVGLVAY